MIKTRRTCSIGKWIGYSQWTCAENPQWSPELQSHYNLYCSSCRGTKRAVKESCWRGAYIRISDQLDFQLSYECDNMINSYDVKVAGLWCVVERKWAMTSLRVGVGTCIVSLNLTSLISLNRLECIRRLQFSNHCWIHCSFWCLGTASRLEGPW